MGGLLVTPMQIAQAAPLADPVDCAPGTVVLNTSDTDCGGLRQTIADAPVGSTVTFSPTLAGQTITLTNLFIEVTKTVTIDGSDAPGLAVSGNGISSIFTTEGGTTVTFTHLSMVNGNTPGYGAAVNAQGNLVLISTTMTNNVAGLNGGAVAVEGGSLVVSGSTFINNVSGEDGGALSVRGALSATRNVFLGNAAVRGGAVSYVGPAGHLVNSLFARNSASTSGDAIYVESAGTTQLRHNTIASPTLTSGAAIYVSTGNVNVVNTLVTSHTTAMQNMTGTLSASYDLFFGNTTDLSGTITSSNLVRTCSEPYFVDPLADDYRIANGSAAINSGTNAGVTVDFDGNARPGNGGFDIGYHETSGTDVAICNLAADNSSPNFLSLATQFTATVGGGTNLDYLWDFGDGITGTGATPTHVYSSAGTFTAHVTATNSVTGSGGLVTASTPVTIVNGVIVGLSAVNDSPTDLGSLTQFTASVTQGVDLVYTWSFGDGITGTGATPSHGYAAIGTYTATVTATNAVSTATASTTVVVNDVAITDLVATSNGPTVLGQSTAFTATIGAGTNVTYAWAFADGQLGSGATPTHTYTSTGTYRVVVTATNATTVLTATTLLTVTNAAPIANTGSGQNVIVGASVLLNGSGSSDPDNHLPLEYGWTQTAGTPVTLSSNTAISPSFTAPLMPTVLSFQLVVTDGFGLVAAAPSTVVITVSDAAITGLVSVNNSPTVLGTSTRFTASISAGTNVSYAWRFGDGSVGSGPTATHTYAAFGIYTAVVTATNSVNTLTAQSLVSITNARPVADAGLDQGVGIAEQVQLNGSGSFDPDNHVPLTYRWTQTGGPAVTLSNNTAVSPTFTSPAAPALLTFTLQVTDAFGLSALTPDTVLVAVDDSPVAGLSARNSSPTTLGTVTYFTASATSASNAIYLWDFGDGQIQNGQTVSHTYAAVGGYTALVTATNGAGSVSATTRVTITDVPVANLIASSNSPTELGNVTQFTATHSAGSNVSYTWNFGDGQTGSGATPTHVYGAVGVFTAVVTASNSAGSVSAATSVIIQDVPVSGLAATSDQPTVLGQPTSFTVTTVAGSNVSYAWAFGDGQTGSGASPQHIYSAAGSFLAVVTATNGAGSVVATTRVAVTNARPQSSVGAGQAVRVGAPVSLSGVASTDPDNHLPLQYGWTQIGGTPVTLTNATSATPSFIAPAVPTVLTFQLVVTDAFGLADLSPSTVVITVSDVAVAGLSAGSNSPVPRGDAVQFTATVTAGSNVVYTWDFGDGETGSGPNPVHAYQTEGHYTAVVTATNTVNSASASTNVTILEIPDEIARLYMPTLQFEYAAP